jgi:hypothetical protein
LNGKSHGVFCVGMIQSNSVEVHKGMNKPQAVLRPLSSLRGVTIFLILITSVIAFATGVCAQEADTADITPEPDIKWRIIELPYVQKRPLQLGLEVFLGLGNHGNIALTRPPDTIKFNLDRFGAWFQFRARFYVGPVGLVGLFDGFADPIGPADPICGEIHSDATSTSSQLLFSFPLELLYYRYHVEPYFGYGWMTDCARAVRGCIGLRYRESYHGKGRVWGCEQVLRFGRGLQIRGIYTFGDYELFDKRLKLEAQWGTDAMPSSYWSILNKKRGGSFVVLGYHRAWKGDGRTDSMVYIGIGARGRL